MTSQEKIQQITIHNDEVIHGFFGKYRFLSNFELCPNGVEFEGMIFPSTENAYQAAKSLNMEVRKQFLTITPSQAKREGRSIKVREDWDSVKVDVMKKVTIEKYLKNHDLAKALLETENRHLREDNYWNDVFWGVCNCVGKNYLGKILMGMRDLLKHYYKNDKNNGI